MRFEIDEPCDEPWDAMTPRGAGRFCARCEKVVIDLTTMTRRQAEATLAKVGGDSACVQLDFDPDERAMFRPEPRRAPHWAGGLVLVAALTAGGCGGRDGSGERSAAIVAEAPAEGCDLPPMLPVGVDASPASGEGASVTAPVPASDAPEAPAEPTAEQRELTAQKHMRRLGQMPIHRRRGRIQRR